MKEQDAIKLLKSIQNPLQDYADIVGAPAFAYGCKYVYPEPEDYAVEEAIVALEEKHSQRWIPVTEKLPEEDGDYLVTMVTPGYLSGQPYTNWLYWDAADCDWLTDEAGDSVPEQETEVVAWRPIPEPYRPETLREVGVEAGQDVAEQVLQSAT